MHRKTSGFTITLVTAIGAGVMYQTYNAASWAYSSLNKVVNPHYSSYAQPIFLAGAFVLGGDSVNAFRQNSWISKYLAGGTSAALIYALSAITYSYLNNNFGGNNSLVSAAIAVGTIACSSLVWNTLFENGINPVLKIGADTLDKLLGFIGEKTGMNLSNSESFTASFKSRQTVSIRVRS